MNLGNFDRLREIM